MAYDPTDWDTADDTAKDTAQHFWTDADGAHISIIPGSADFGQNVLLQTDGLHIRYGTTELAKFLDYMAQIGGNGTSHMEIYASGMDMWVGYTDSQDQYQLENVLNVSYNPSNDYSRITAPGAGLWLQGNDGNITIASKSNDASAAVRLRGGRMQVVDQTGTQLWTGTAQELADALNFKATAPRIYNGVKTVNVGNTSQTSAMIWTAAQFESAFNVSSGHAGDCGVMLCNGNVQAGQLGAVSAEWWNSSYNPYGWRARWTIGATGNKAFSYVVVVPASYSTV